MVCICVRRGSRQIIKKKTQNNITINITTNSQISTTIISQTQTKPRTKKKTKENIKEEIREENRGGEEGMWNRHTEELYVKNTINSSLYQDRYDHYSNIRHTM